MAQVQMEVRKNQVLEAIPDWNGARTLPKIMIFIPNLGGVRAAAQSAEATVSRPPAPSAGFYG